MLLLIPYFTPPICSCRAATVPVSLKPLTSSRKRRIMQKVHAMLLHMLQPNSTELTCLQFLLFCMCNFVRHACLYEELTLCSPSDNFLSAAAELPCWKHGKPLWEVAIVYVMLAFLLCQFCSLVPGVTSQCQLHPHKLFTCKAIRHLC